MITGVSKVILEVGDLDSVIEFWVQKAGFRLTYDESYGTERWAEVRPPAGEPVVVLHKRPAAQARSPVPEQLPHSNIFFMCDDLVKTFQEIVDRGVHFPSPPAEMHFGWWSMFEDNEGTRYALIPAEQDAPAD